MIYEERRMALELDEPFDDDCTLLVFPDDEEDTVVIPNFEYVAKALDQASEGGSSTLPR